MVATPVAEVCKSVSIFMSTVSALPISRAFLEALVRRCELRGASLFLPDVPGYSGGGLLVHAGEGRVSELADPVSAMQLAERFAAQTGVGVEALTSDDGVLLRVWGDPESTRKPATTGRRRSDGAQPRAGRRPIWLGLSGGPGSVLPSAGDELGSLEESAVGSAALTVALDLAGALGVHLREVTRVLNDPVTGVPGRAEFQARLANAFRKAGKASAPLALLLVAPDDFAMVNDRIGHHEGDLVLREVGARTVSALRATDFAARYGGAIFAALLKATDGESALTVGAKLLRHLHEGGFREGAVVLGFRAGIATFDPATSDPQSAVDLAFRAEEALLHARRTAGERLVSWSPELELLRDQGAELGGVFTGNMTKDYRNVQLLADIVRVVAGSDDFHQLADRALERLQLSLKTDRIGLFEWLDGSGLSLIQGRSAGGESTSTRLENFQLKEPGQRLLRQCRDQRRPLLERDDRGARSAVVCAVPMAVGNETVGLLYLEGSGDTFNLDASDLTFLRSLASQLAVALDRARLSLQEKRRTEQVQEQLRAEVEELRQAVQKANLEYRSESMESVMATVRRVAPTEATVLITGESGTGKELIASTLHQLSERRQRPLMVVDCTAIPTTLMESELFGHEKGAFSGADQKRIGRLEQAHGGTVFLDEIGELPLEVQSKLLRFVQEKQLTPVGSVKARTVDARVVAATHRDLLAEVREGRFREDLYYRLNVVRVAVPPLRQRRDDILHLARHYLKTYSVLHHRPEVSLSEDTVAALLGHDWPGNVRELQNRVQQAVILSETDVLAPASVGLDQAGPSSGPVLVPVPSPSGSTAAGASAGAPDPVSGTTSAEDALRRLRELFAHYIANVVEKGSAVVPLGQWINEDLVLEADRAQDGVACRAAQRLELAETTYRRRRDKAALRREAGLAPRPDWWQPVRHLLAYLVEADEVVDRMDLGGRDLIGFVQSLLLAEILAQVDGNIRQGSALLGVTAATYRRRVSEIEEELDSPAAESAARRISVS